MGVFSMTEEEITQTEEPNTTDSEVESVDLWITTNDVINFHGLKPKNFNLEKDNTTELNNILTQWILQAQSLIETYCHREYTSETVNNAVKNICLRLVSNMVTLSIQRRDTPIIKVNDWSISTVPSNIFTDDLKNDLKPFIKDSSNDYKKIDFFAITGDD